VVRRGNVFDDEDFFAGLDQPELATGDVFHGRRIVLQPARLFHQPGVPGALARERGGQRVVLSANAKHREQSAVAGERIEDDHDGDEQQADVQQPAVAGPAADCPGVSPDGLRSVGRRHEGTKIHQNRSKYN
jgi:hypothetical protein